MKKTYPTQNIEECCVEISSYSDWNCQTDRQNDRTTDWHVDWQ